MTLSCFDMKWTRFSKRLNLQGIMKASILCMDISHCLKLEASRSKICLWQIKSQNLKYFDPLALFKQWISKRKVKPQKKRKEIEWRKNQFLSLMKRKFKSSLTWMNKFGIRFHQILFMFDNLRLVKNSCWKSNFQSKRR